MKQKLLIFLFVIIFHTPLNAQNTDEILVGNPNSKVTIKIFSSFTCPHCANFHKNIYSKIEQNFIKNEKVKVIFADFPLDIAALNAAKIARCTSKESSILIIDELYKEQNNWSKGNTVEQINANLFVIGNKFKISNEKMQNCLTNKKIEEKILNSRIEAQNKYKVSSTPTIVINEKRFEQNLTYENISRELSRLIK